MVNPDKVKWTGSGYFYQASLLGGLLILMIDVYPPHPEKGNAYQIRIKGNRIEKIANKVWLPDLEAAKIAAVNRLNKLSQEDEQ